MKTRLQFVSGCFVCLLLLSGCGGMDKGGPIAPVSGTVTLEGQPMSGVEVVFSPKPMDGNNSPGPYSVGTTDAQGKYTLKTRYGDDGAVIGKHNVNFQYPDIEAGVMEELGAELREAKESDEEGRDETVAEVQGRIDALRAKLKDRQLIPSTADREVDVPSGGNTSMDFDFTKD